MYLCICFFRFDLSTKKLFVNFHYHVLFFSFFCLAAVSSSCKYCKHSALMIIFWYIKIKYSWKLIISLLKYCTLHKTQFALQYIDHHIFLLWLILPGILVYFSDLLAVKNVNLVLWLKVHVAFNGLHILILSVM